MMDLYLTCLALGGVGLGSMALSGFLHRAPGHGPVHAHGAAAHGHAHGGHGAAAHGPHSQGGAAHGTHAPAAGAHSTQGHTHASEGGGSSGRGIDGLLALMSPRLLFSVCLGLGTTGLVLEPFIGGPLLFIAALLGGFLFERLLVSPIWKFAFRFESAPALTLEHSTGSEARAVTTFDADGQGLIAIDVDGQIVQLLGTLRAADRAYRTRVTAGTMLRIEDVDAARNRCTVSLL